MCAISSCGCRICEYLQQKKAEVKEERHKMNDRHAEVIWECNSVCLASSAFLVAFPLLSAQCNNFVSSFWKQSQNRDIRRRQKGGKTFLQVFLCLPASQPTNNRYLLFPSFPTATCWRVAASRKIAFVL